MLPTIALLVFTLNIVYVTDGARFLATSTAGSSSPAATASSPPGGCPCGASWGVKPNDTLYSISIECGYTVDQLATENNVVNVNIILAGQRLRMPNCAPVGSVTSGSSSRLPSRSPSLSPRTSPSPSGSRSTHGSISSAATTSSPPGDCPCGAYWDVKPNDTLSNISILCGYNVSQLADENNIVNENYIWAGQRLRMPNCAPVGFGTSGGRCGVHSSFTSSQNGYTCPPSQCCSSGGWCGATTDHCSRAKGCNDKYGVCLTDGVNFQPNVSQCSSSVQDAATSQLTSWQPGNASNIEFTSMTIQECCEACTMAVENGGTCLRGQPNGAQYYWVHIVDPSRDDVLVCDPVLSWWWSFGKK